MPSTTFKSESLPFLNSNEMGPVPAVEVHMMVYGLPAGTTVPAEGLLIGLSRAEASATRLDNATSAVVKKRILELIVFGGIRLMIKAALPGGAEKKINTT